jgi:hypothetical protein
MCWVFVILICMMLTNNAQESVMSMVYVPAIPKRMRKVGVFDCHPKSDRMHQASMQEK